MIDQPQSIDVHRSQQIGITMVLSPYSRQTLFNAFAIPSDLYCQPTTTDSETSAIAGHRVL